MTRLALAALLAASLLAACSAPGERDLAVRDELEAALRGYLPRLGQVYAEHDFSVLEGYAAGKEIAALRGRIDELAAQGRLLEPELRQLTIEDWNVWSHSNAYVTTVEVWDLRVLSTGSRQVLSEELGQRNRVKYQMKRDRDAAAGWLVLFRAIVKNPGA